MITSTHRFRAWLVLPLLLLAAAPVLRAGEYLVQVWGVDEGLPQSSVTDVKQTPDGHLWIGTLLGGLARFDGVEFTSFNLVNTPSLKHPGIRRLACDSEGVLWVNDYGGNLLRLQDREFVTEDVPNVQLGSLVLDRLDRRVFAALSGDLIDGRRGGDGRWAWQIFKMPHAGGSPYYVSDAGGTLWYRHSNSKLGRFAGGQFDVCDLPSQLKGRKLQTLAQGDTGEIWLGTEAELARWDGSNCTVILPAGETNLLIRHIVPLGGDRAWVEANNRLRRLHGHTWDAEAVGWDGAQSPWSRTRTLRHDEEGGLWISLREEGLAHVRADGSIHRITREGGLPSQLVQAFQPDAEGNLWAGYHRGGLVRVRRSLFRTVARPEGLADTVVLTIAEDKQGAVWMGTGSGIVARWQDERLTNFTLPLLGAFCQEAVVCAGPDGRIWAGTSGNGLLVHEAGQFRHVLPPAQVPRGVRTLLVRRDGSVWFTDFSGLHRVVEDRAERVLEFKRTDDVAGSLVEGPDGSLWMGTLGGSLLRRNGEGWETFQPADGRPASRFWALLPEADGSVWIGTLDQGLLYFKDGRFVRFTRDDGLVDEGISQILSDGQDLWLGSRVGIQRVARVSLLRRAGKEVDSVACRVFGRGNGLLTTAMALEFGPNCVATRDGRLWFSSANGAASALPSDVGHRQASRAAFVEGILADGKPVFNGSNRPGFPLDPAQTLRLGPGLRNLEIRYTTPNLSAPELVRFRYRLADVDSEWQYAGTRRSITFTRLPPGRYQFHVSARNSDGIWSSADAAFAFVVQPQFWERRLFQGGLALLLGSLGLGAMRLITKRRMQRKLDRLERQRALEQERTRIAQDLHDDLGAGLTEISLTSDLAANPELDPSASVRFVQEIGSKARELVATMDEIVWAVNPRNDSLASLAAYCCQYAQHFLTSAGIRCRLEVDESLPTALLNSEQRHQLFLAFKEALNNLVRHSGAAEARLGIVAIAGQLKLTLEDDGRGFSGPVASEGADGLKNMAERLRRIGGTCEVRSQPEGGTRVTFTMPLPGKKF